MKFLCLVHVDQGAMDALGPEEREAFDLDNREYGQWLLASDSLLAGGPLDPPATATLLRAAKGRVSMTDGPYVETKEHMGGFMLLEVRDRAEALAIAGRSPVARVGTIEVRRANEIGSE